MGVLKHRAHRVHGEGESRRERADGRKQPRERKAEREQPGERKAGREHPGERKAGRG